MSNNAIEIPVIELKPVIQGFSKVIQKRPTVPVLGCILIESRGGCLRISATNLDDYVTWTTNLIAPNPDFRVLVRFESIAKVIKGCSNDAMITVSLHKDELRFSYPLGNTTMMERASTVPLEEWPELPRTSFTDSVPVGEDFKEALITAFDSTSTDETRYLLHHAYVDVSDQEAHYVVGTNGREMFAANSFKLGFKESLMVPHRKFLLWSGFLDDGDWNVSLSEATGKKPDAGWVKVESKTWTLVTRQIDGTYPNWKTPIPTGDISMKINFNDEACQFLKLAVPKLPCSDPINKGIALEGTAKGSVFIHSADEANTVSLPITGGTAQGQGRFCINREYLTKALKLGLTQVNVHEPHVPIVFQQGGKRLIVAPLRVDSVAESPTSSEAKPEAHTQDPEPVQPSSPAHATEPPEEEQRSEMKTTNRIENTTVNHADASTPAQAFEQVKEQLEKGKEMFKGGITCVNDALKLLAVAQRERRAAEKEIEEVRSTLQSLQKIRI